MAFTSESLLQPALSLEKDPGPSSGFRVLRFRVFFFFLGFCFFLGFGVLGFLGFRV